MSKKLNIKIDYGKSNVVIEEFSKRKPSDKRYKDLINSTKLYDGTRYTENFIISRVK